MTTRDNRASVLGFGLAALLVLPSPGSLDQGDRQQTAFSYRGILAASPQVPTALNLCTAETVNLVPTRRTVSLVPARETASLVPLRRTRTVCP